MALPVIETDRLDAGKALERPGETHRRILAAGKQHERASIVTAQLTECYPSSHVPIRSTASRMSSREPA